MLIIFEGMDEVIICEVDQEGLPIGDKEFFKKGCGRDREDYDRKPVEGPIRMKFNKQGFSIRTERELA